MAKGWNLFTIRPSLIGKTIREVQGTCTVVKVFGFKQSEQIWNNIPFDYSFKKDELGYGLAIKVSEDCIFDKVVIPEEVISGVPALPE